MRNATLSSLRRSRLPILLIVDCLSWFLGIYLASAMRLDSWTLASEFGFDAAYPQLPLYGIAILGAVGALLHTALAWLLRAHQGRHALGSFEEMLVIGGIMLSVGLVVTTLNAVVEPRYVPRTSPAVASCIAFLLAAWPRALWRARVAQPRRQHFRADAKPVVIVGAGEGGRELVRTILRDPDHTWEPVAFLDDDPRKRYFRFQGIPVRGTTVDLGCVASSFEASTVIIAMPSADSEVISRINTESIRHGLEVKVLPGVHELLDGRVSLDSVRDISPVDLLGRHQVETDVESIAGYLEGRRVLVTGAGGSIGSELCRQIVRFSPETLVMLDRDESALHALLLSIEGRADLEAPNVALADIRDAARVREIFEALRPEVVFHAAALKHVNLLEQHPAEAVKTNVIGTQNVLDAATVSGVTRFVNVSTDKAADPINALGYSKRIAELQTAHQGLEASGTYISVRFGNVLGTRGSVLTTFAEQIRSGGPVTVTDPDVTRYFMTIDEAVQLVIQAAAIGRDGEALVLDMGEPKKIIDVANQMIEQSDERIDIEITGLKPGEKLHEALFGSGELDRRPVHPLVSHVAVPRERIDSDQLRGDTESTLRAMRAACSAPTSGVSESAIS